MHLITLISTSDGLPCLHAVMHGCRFRGRGSLPGLFPETDRLRIATAIVGTVASRHAMRCSCMPRSCSCMPSLSLAACGLPPSIQNKSSYRSRNVAAAACAASTSLWPPVRARRSDPFTQYQTILLRTCMHALCAYVYTRTQALLLYCYNTKTILLGVWFFFVLY